MNEPAYNFDASQGGTPQQIAKQLFSGEAKKPNSIGILPYSRGWDDDTASLNFEILITIYMEGLLNILEVIKKEYAKVNGSISDNDKLNWEVYKNIELDDLKFPVPWFKSIGYNIDITEYDACDDASKEYFNTSVKPDSYCKILLKFDPKDKLHFVRKLIVPDYTFLLCASYKQTNKLEKIYAVLSKGDKFYKIWFSPNHV